MALKKPRRDSRASTKSPSNSSSHGAPASAASQVEATPAHAAAEGAKKTATEEITVLPSLHGEAKGSSGKEFQ